MRQAVWIGILSWLAGPAAAYAQQAGDDYSTDFGGETAGAQGAGQRYDGPHSIAEAKQQRRGYRIGTAAVHGASPEEDVHVVQEGDTLWDISQHYFGDPWHWPELWSYNPEITNPHWIYPRDQIRLSPQTLSADQTVAQLKKGGPSGLEKAPVSAGVLAGTETASSVVVPRGAWKPGMIFLHDQGYLDDDALRASGQIIGGNQENMLLSPSDQVYVKFSGDQNIAAGQSYTVFRKMPKADRGRHEKGTLVRILGTIVVRNYDRDKHVARGIVTEALDPIERGLFVAKLDRRFDLVAAKPNQANVAARIIASVHPRTLLSYGNVVFLDVGEGHGIEPGNRFFVVRRGDNWLESLQADPVDFGNVAEVPKYDRSILPKEVVAELRVIKVRKTTTIALVIRSDTDLTVGDYAEMRVGF